jgi:hypothetical protein
MAKPKAVAEDTGFEVGEEDDDNAVVDFDNIEAPKWDAIPKGWYNGLIISMEYKRSQSANKPMWELRLQIDEGDHNKRTFYTYISFSEKALPGTKLFLSKVAPQLLEAPLNPKQAADDGVLIGVPVKFRLDIEMWEGQKRNRVKSIDARQAGNAFLGN